MTAWLGICTLLGGGAAAVGFAAGLASGMPDFALHPLAWEAAHGLERPWTLWSAAWVHSSNGSLTGNLLALGALAVVGASLRVGREAAAALFIAWPLGTLGLLWWPDASSYSGLGGPIHAAAMVLWAHMALRPSLKPLSLVLFIGMALKLLIERAWAQPVVFDPSWGFNVVYAAHLTGALAGAVCGLAGESASRLRTRRTP